MVHDFDELKAHAAEVRGSIVLYEAKFDQRLADNGEAGDAYGQAGLYRFSGPAAAAAQVPAWASPRGLQVRSQGHAR